MTFTSKARYRLLFIFRDGDDETVSNCFVNQGAFLVNCLVSSALAVLTCRALAKMCLFVSSFYYRFVAIRYP